MLTTIMVAVDLGADKSPTTEDVPIYLGTYQEDHQPRPVEKAFLFNFNWAHDNLFTAIAQKITDLYGLTKLHGWTQAYESPHGGWFTIYHFDYEDDTEETPDEDLQRGKSPTWGPWGDEGRQGH